MGQQSSDSSMSSRGRKFALHLAVAAGVTFASALNAGDAAAGERVVVRVAPPSPRVEVIPRAPSAQYAWAPGYWGWRPHHGHVWLGGHWIVAQPGYTWEPAHWSERGGYWHFVDGHWRRP